MDAEGGRMRAGRDDPAERRVRPTSRADRSTDTSDSVRSRRRVLKSIAGIGAGGLGLGVAARRPESHGAENSTHEHGLDGGGEVGGSRSGERIHVGIHEGSDAGAVGRADRIESWIGPRFDVQNVFIPWDDGRYELDELFGRVLPGIWAAGRTPMLTWEPYLTSGPTPENVLERITAGEYDAFLTEWAERMSAAIARANVRHPWMRTKRPAAYVRLAHEANGNWYPWAPASGKGTPEEYASMWRYVRSRVERELEAGSLLAWTWAVNGVDVGPYTMEELYPGDAVVDRAGVDNYNWGTSQPWSRWRSPEELFAGPVARVREIVGNDVPIGVTEFASSSLTEEGYDVERKAAWIREAFGALDRAGVDMAVWFNRDRKTDWAVFDGERGTDRITGDRRRYEVYPAYKDGILARRR